MEKCQVLSTMRENIGASLKLFLPYEPINAAAVKALFDDVVPFSQFPDRIPVEEKHLQWLYDLLMELEG